MQVYLALGSNVGHREENLRRALSYLAERLQLTGCSSVYETEPWGYAPQPPFLNLVCSALTDLSPRDLLSLVKEVERRMGRTLAARYGPRVIDVDILLYGQWVMEEPDLTIPHPLMAERAFVLIPLAEVAPDALHPLRRQTAAQLRERVAGRSGVSWWSPSPLAG